MDVCVAVGAPLDRWALVGSLGVDPAVAMDLGTAFARLVHPTGTSGCVILLVRGGADVAWLRQVRASLGSRRQPTVVAVLAEGPPAAHLLAAGADAVVNWDTDRPFPREAIAAALRRVTSGDGVAVVPAADLSAHSA